MRKKYSITFQSTGILGTAKSPDVYETTCSSVEEVIEEYCYKNNVMRSEIQNVVPLVVSKDGPGIYGDGYYLKSSYHDKPASAFKALTVLPTKLVGTLWRDANNRFLDYLLKITEVHGNNSSDPYDYTQWDVEYVEINPRTMTVVKGDSFGVFNPTYKHMNLAEFTHRYYCDKMP